MYNNLVILLALDHSGNLIQDPLYPTNEFRLWLKNVYKCDEANKCSRGFAFGSKMYIKNDEVTKRIKDNLYKNFVILSDSDLVPLRREES